LVLRPTFDMLYLCQMEARQSVIRVTGNCEASHLTTKVA
jgi:hypothetical protein